jgi:hypothetical protein
MNIVGNCPKISFATMISVITLRFFPAFAISGLCGRLPKRFLVWLCALSSTKMPSFLRPYFPKIRV